MHYEDSAAFPNTLQIHVFVDLAFSGTFSFQLRLIRQLTPRRERHRHRTAKRLHQNGMRPQRYEHGIRRLTHMLPNHSLGTVCKLARGCSKSRSKVDPSRAPRFASRFSCSGFATGAKRKPAIRSQSLALRPSQEPAIRSRLLASPPIVWKPAIRSQSLAVPPSLERCALKGLGGTREAITIMLHMYQK